MSHWDVNLSEYPLEDILALCGVVGAFVLFRLLGRIDRGKHPRRFAKLASALGVPVTQADAFEVRFALTVGQRPFVVTQNLNSRGGWYLMASTPLTAAWQSHFMNVRRLGRMGAWLAGRVLKKQPSDAPRRDGFGARYAVSEQGNLRQGWMSDAVRQAIREFYEVPALADWVAGAELEASQGQLVWRMHSPDQLPADDYKTLLIRQAAVADALNTAAQRPGQFF
jgi:hypothetical protein